MVFESQIVGEKGVLVGQTVPGPFATDVRYCPNQEYGS